MSQSWHYRTVVTAAEVRRSTAPIVRGRLPSAWGRSTRLSLKGVWWHADCSEVNGLRGFFAVWLGLILILCGCGDGGPSADMARAERYGTVVALRDAAITAGMPCPHFFQGNQVRYALESADCGWDSVLAVYASEEDRDRLLDDFFAAGGMDRPLLVGPTWVINAPEAASLQAQLGGDLKAS